MKTYKTYQARNAVKAAEVTNHIKACKKLGIPHAKAKAEAYRLYSIKAALPILKRRFEIERNATVVMEFKQDCAFGLATTPPAELLSS
jgi:hypothetical protein